MAKQIKGSEDTNVTFDDQKKINLFARKNARLSEILAEIEDKEKYLQNLEDASDDLMLLDEDEVGQVPFLIGEVFINHSFDRTQILIEEFKEEIKNETKTLQSTASDIRAVMSDLKVKLYAKFGDNINLEPDDE